MLQLFIASGLQPLDGSLIPNHFEQQKRYCSISWTLLPPPCRLPSALHWVTRPNTSINIFKWHTINTVNDTELYFSPWMLLAWTFSTMAVASDVGRDYKKFIYCVVIYHPAFRGENFNISFPIAIGRWKLSPWDSALGPNKLSLFYLSISQDWRSG